MKKILENYMITSFIKEKINSPEQSGRFSRGSASQANNESAMAYASMIHHSVAARNRFGFSRTTVTIAISIKFGHKCVEVGAHYYKDLAKMAGLLKENSSLIATLEPCVWPNYSAIPLEITKLRLRNVMNYLVDNFSLPRSRFYVDKLTLPAALGEPCESSSEACGGIAVILKYPSILS